jgi:hypothetical protein
MMPARASDLIRAVYPLALVIAGATMAAQPQDTVNFLRGELGFSNSDVRRIAEGRAAVRTLDTTGDREVAIGGAIRVALSADQYVAELRDIVEFKRHEAVRQIGVFGPTPSVADLAGLTLEPEHVDDLRDCRPQDCDLQLSRGAITRIQQIPWSAGDATVQANRAFREILAGLVTQYRRSGDAALMVYDDERRPVALADEFRSMTSAPESLLPRFAALQRYLAQYPGGDRSNVEDVIYWSKEDVGPEVVISVTHMAIMRIDDGGPVRYAAASKQVYGSHYFDSSLGLTLLLRDEQPGSIVLVYINRSRIDALDGFLGGVKRAIVRSRGKSALEDTLVRIRTRLPARVMGAQE